MLKLPQAGRVKTRLAAGIGAQAASELYAAFVEDLVGKLAGREWDLIAAVDGPVSRFQAWLPGVAEFWRQGPGDLGERLDRLVRRGFQRSSAPVVLLGSDLPQLQTQQLELALALVEQHQVDLVLGPAYDGGYYLMALGAPYPLFEDIPWSQPGVLRQTLRRARDLGLRVRQLELERDVDTRADWLALARRIRRGENLGLPRTAEWALTKKRSATRPIGQTTPEPDLVPDKRGASLGPDPEQRRGPAIAEDRGPVWISPPGSSKSLSDR